MHPNIIQGMTSRNDQKVIPVFSQSNEQTSFVNPTTKYGGLANRMNQNSRSKIVNQKHKQGGAVVNSGSILKTTKASNNGNKRG